jgi:hypothetical protein
MRVPPHWLSIPLAQQIRCVKRELRKRQEVYPRLVAQGTMPQAFADDQTATMVAVLATLEWLLAEEQRYHQLELFGPEEAPHD